MKQKNWMLLAGLFAGVSLIVVTGCDTFARRSHHRTSSVLEYLYPSENEHVDLPTIPVLSLPLKVGIAFVPENNSDARGDMYMSDDSAFTEKQKVDLMKEVGDDFKKYPFVQSISVIPSTYLVPKGGFANVEQLKRMFNVDIIVLLSYDQVQFTDHGLLSLTYLTVVGEALISGEKNDTQTMVDAVVYDIQSRKLLFRAPGTSRVKASATPLDLSVELRENGELGLKLAATNLVTNLQEQLELFKDQVKNSPEEFKIVRKPGYTGAGSFGGIELTLAAAIGIFSLCTRKTRQTQ